MLFLFVAIKTNASTWGCVYYGALSATAAGTGGAGHLTVLGAGTTFWELGSGLTSWSQQGGARGCVHGRWQLTLPTSTRLVTMMMLAVFSCHTILQKSEMVSCMGPAVREKGHVAFLWEPFTWRFFGTCKYIPGHPLVGPSSM